MLLLETAVRFDLFVSCLDGVKTLAGLLFVRFTQIQHLVRVELHREFSVGFLTSESVADGLISSTL